MKKKIMVGYDPLQEEYSVIWFRIYKGMDERARNFSQFANEEPRTFRSHDEVKGFLLE
jgi:hypothetical protein